MIAQRIEEILEECVDDYYKQTHPIKEITHLILQAILESLPEPKQVAYTEVKRFMGKDGKIVETERNTHYSKEDAAWNACIAEIKTKIEERI